MKCCNASSCIYNLLWFCRTQDSFNTFVAEKKQQGVFTQELAYRNLHDFLAKIFFVCEICNKVVDKRIKYQLHVRYHSRCCHHKCDVCDKGFYAIQQLEKQKQIHSGE